MRQFYTISDNKHAKELVKLGFSDRLITTPGDCEAYLEHCNKYNMKFLNGSYGTLVHKKFKNHFKESQSQKIYNKLGLTKYGVIQRSNEVHNLMDHTNLFRSQIDKKVYILTSSPYKTLNYAIFKVIEHYPYNAYVINPNFLDYIAFVTKEHREWNPLSNLNYAFTEAQPMQIAGINDAIYKDIGLYPAFTLIKEGNQL